MILEELLEVHLVDLPPVLQLQRFAHQLAYVYSSCCQNSFFDQVSYARTIQLAHSHTRRYLQQSKRWLPIRTGEAERSLTNHYIYVSLTCAGVCRPHGNTNSWL
jgi:hypothetical protein